MPGYGRPGQDGPREKKKATQRQEHNTNEDAPEVEPERAPCVRDQVRKSLMGYARLRPSQITNEAYLDRQNPAGIDYKDGATLIVKNEANNKKLGWVCYKLTHNQNEVTVEKTMTDLQPWIVSTTNANPGIVGAEHHFENQTEEPLSEILLSLSQSAQTIVNLESMHPGYAILEEGRFVFEPPIDPGTWGSARWDYDAPGPDPDVLTEVLFTPVFLGYVVEPLAVTTGPGQRQGKVKVLKANGQNQVLPPLKIEECKAGGLPQSLVIRCDANMSFVDETALARVSVGDLTVVARPKIQAGGKELLLSIGKSRSRTKGTIVLSGIQVRMAKGAFGPLRIFVPVGKSWRTVRVGVVR